MEVEGLEDMVICQREVMRMFAHKKELTFKEIRDGFDEVKYLGNIKLCLREAIWELSFSDVLEVHDPEMRPLTVIGLNKR